MSWWTRRIIGSSLASAWADLISRFILKVLAPYRCESETKHKYLFDLFYVIKSTQIHFDLDLSITFPKKKNCIWNFIISKDSLGETLRTVIIVGNTYSSLTHNTRLTLPENTKGEKKSKGASQETLILLSVACKNAVHSEQGWRWSERQLERSAQKHCVKRKRDQPSQ